MKKTKQMILVTILCFAFSVTAFTDVLDVDSTNAVKGMVCDKCGGNLYNSNKTFSIFVKEAPIKCGCVLGTSNWGNDYIITFDVYDTYVCSGCGATTPRDYLWQQDKYWCSEAYVFYNLETGQAW